MTDRELLEKIAAQVGVLANDMQGMKSDVGALTGQVGVLANDMQGMKSDVGALTGQVGVLANDMQGMKSDVGALTGQVGVLANGMQGMKSDVGALTDQVGTLTHKTVEIEKDLKDVKKTVIKIEDEHGKKLSTLFDGYKQNSDILERVEKEVSKHDEIILRRVQ